MLARLLCALLACAALAARQDGPCIQWTGRTARISSFDGSKVETRERKAPFALALPGLAAEPVRIAGRPFKPDPAECPAPPKILAVSDIHGNLDGLIALLQAHGVVDRKLRWAYGLGHLVIAGDVMDRGIQVTQAFWFIRGLEAPARRAGGGVHLLLGNHELMVAAGDLRYTQPVYVHPPDGMPGLAERLGPDGELGRWLWAKPALLKLGPFLFLHGGLSPAFVDRRFTLAKANGLLRAHIGDRSPEGDAAFLLGPEGPLWFRGLAEEGGIEGAAVDRMLKAFRVKAVVVGHTTLPEVTAFHGGRVYVIDAGLKEGRGEVWIWEKGHAWRGLMDGSRVTLD